MSAIDATTRVTADWLCETKPVVHTGRTKDQPLMADPFPIFQQVVKAFPDFFKEEYGYVPDPSSKTGLAGVRSKVYTETLVAKNTRKTPPKGQEFDGSGGCEEGAEVTATRRRCQ